MTANPKTKLAHAIVHILRPLIRVLIRHEFTHADLTELVRQTYVEVAYDAFSIPEKEMTYSRAAVLTGLSRKEVVRLRAVLDAPGIQIKEAPNRAQRVVHGWLSDKEFLDKKGKPKVLPIKAEKGSFLSLVQRYSGDITYGAVLDELNHVGVTSQPDPDSVRLVNLAYIPHKDEFEKVRIMSVCASDLLQSSVHNIEHSEETLYFQRQVSYSEIEESQAEEFQQLSSKKASSLLRSLSEDLSRKSKSSKGKRGTGKRIGVGIYYFENDISDKATKDKIEKRKYS